MNDIDTVIYFIKSLNDENLNNIIEGQENVLALLNELSKYRELSTLDGIEEMIELGTQKKVTKIIPVVGNAEKYECPNCGSGLTEADVFAGHCKWCGQAVKL